MLGFTLMGRRRAHRGFQSWQYQILSMIVGYILVAYVVLCYIGFIKDRIVYFFPFHSPLFFFLGRFSN